MTETDFVWCFVCFCVLSGRKNTLKQTKHLPSPGKCNGQIRFNHNVLVRT